MNVALQGGPLSGWWYDGPGWEAACESARYFNHTPDGPGGWVLGYVRGHGTVSQTLGKKKKVLYAEVWTWRPATYTATSTATHQGS